VEVVPICGALVTINMGRWNLRCSASVQQGCRVYSVCVWRKLVMKAWSVLGLLVGAAMFATIPISPQVTPSGLELSVDHAQAITYGHYRRVHRRVYRRAYRRGYYGASY
jgi:hypothetical protein